MNLIIFGTGKRYESHKHRLDKGIFITALLDNHPRQQAVDGIPVYLPEQIGALTYDYILLMSRDEAAMKAQLMGLGVEEEKICGLGQIERFLVREPLARYGEWDGFRQGDGKRVLFFSPGLTSSGAEYMMYLTIKLLKDMGHVPVVLSKRDGALGKELEGIGVSSYVVENWFLDNEFVRNLVNWADLIFVNTLQMYGQVYRLLGAGKRILWWLHEYTGLGEIRRDELAAVLASGNAGGVRIYAVSERVRSEVLKACGVDGACTEETGIEILPIGVERMDEVPAADGGNRMVFAVIGVICSIKGQDVFIRAAAGLPQEYRRQARFLLVGPGSPENVGIAAEGGGRDTREKAGTCVYEPESGVVIEMTGQISHGEISEIYNAVDVVVCASRCEGMSATALEGFSCGKPLITSDAAGIADFITDGAEGLVFANEDAESLREKMMWMLDNREQASDMGKRGRLLYEKCFSEEAFRDRMSRILEEALR